MDARRARTGAVVALLGALAATALYGGSSPAAAAPVWPLDVTYEISTTVGKTTFVSVQRLRGDSWGSWSNEVMTLEALGPVSGDIGIPRGPGSTVTLTPDGQVTVIHYPGLVEEEWEPHISTSTAETDLFVPHELMSPNLANSEQIPIDVGGQLSDATAAVSGAEEVLAELDIGSDNVEALEVIEEWTCSTGSGCKEEVVHQETIRSVYSPSADLPLVVERITDGAVTERLRVLSVE